MSQRAKRSIIWKITKENLINVVKTSKSFSEILKHFGMINKGGNCITLKKRCGEENIDISHIPIGNSSNRGRKFIKDKTPLEKILVVDSNFSRVHLKKRIIEENIIDYKCKKCGNTGEWLGEKISLHLEHINGVSNDNRLENICFLCPNCHSQTETYAGKNLPRVKYNCSECGKVITKCCKSGKCLSCLGKNKRVFDATKETLESLIETKPMTKIGEMFGVSDNAIRKRCKKLGISL